MPVSLKKVKHPYIISLKTHCGGSPIIAGTKFPVKSVVYYILRQGITPEELVREFKHLKLEYIYDAISYYYDNKKEIDRELSVDEGHLREKLKRN